MAKENRVSFFNPQSDFAGGGTFFADGLYHNDQFRFTMYNFGDDSKPAATCLMGKMTPVDASGNATGEPVVQYWPVNVMGKNEFIPTKDGTGLMAGPDAEHDKPWGGSAFAVFMKQLAKAWPDVEQFDNDVSVMDGRLMEYGKIVKEERGGKNRPATDDGGEATNNGPKQIIVVTSVPKSNGASKKAAAPAKSAPAAAAPGKKAAAKASDDSAEDILATYLAETLDGKESPQSKITFRMGMMTALGKKGVDAETCREVAKLFNDAEVLGPMLAACGWSISENGKELVKDE